MKCSILKVLLPALVLLLLTSHQAEACTTAVISGKFTQTGRPMIWKVRDTESYENAMHRYSDGKWPYVGLINADDSTGAQVWGGFNEMGFAIMNSASFNVNTGYKDSFIDREGYVMREALRTCQTLSDFETLLNNRPRPMGLAAHFGVIDAKGGAAFYEVNNETWTKYDANDPTTAPRGFVLRTNYSLTGRQGEGYGFIRCQTAEYIFANVPDGGLTVPMLMQDFSRCSFNPITQIDLRQIFSNKPKGKYPLVASDDLICRYGTASTIVVEGVTQGEQADQTTGWVQIGLPWVSISLPVWTVGTLSPLLMPNNSRKKSQLGDWCMQLKKQIFPLWQQSDGYHYANAGLLFNAEGTGLTQRIEAVEHDIFARTNEARVYWRIQKGFGRKSKHSPQTLIQDFDARVKRLYTDLLELQAEPTTSTK